MQIAMKFLAILFLSLGAAQWLQAQTMLTGRVADRRGDAVSGARVTARIAGTATTQSAVTDSEGRFTLAIVPGTYELTVTASGFTEFAQTLKPADLSLSLNITLDPATVAEQIVVTATRAAVRLADAPASVSLLNARDVQQAGAQTIDDLLRQVPGFSLFRRSSSAVANPTTQGVSLRGVGASGASRTLVLADGVPLNDAFGGWVYWDRVPRASIQQVELVRGGASDLYGSDALSGVIHLISRSEAERAVSFEASYGTRDTADVTFFANHKWRGFSAAVSGEATRSDGYFLLAPQLRGLADERAASQHRVLALRLQQEVGTGGAFFARGSLFDEDRRNGTRLQRNDTATESVATGWRGRTSDGSNWNLTLFGNQQRFHQNFTAVAANRNTEALTRLQFVPSRDAGLAFNWSRSFFEKHLLVAGADLRGVRGTSDEEVYANGRAVSFISAGGRQRRAGFFAQDIWQITARLTLTGSARYDNWRDSSAASVERVLATGVVRPRFFAPRSTDAFSPRINLSFAITPGFGVRVAGYKAFRAPTLNELYRSFRVGDTQTLANAGLIAERLTGGEAGFNFTSLRAVSARVTGFWTETKNPITNFTLSVTPTLITRERRNLGRIRSRGIEMEAELRAAQYWRLSAGYLFVDATVREAPQDASLVGLRLPQVARHQFTLQASYAHPRYASVAVQFRATGRQFDDDQNRFALGSFAVIDASVAKPLGPHLELFLAVQNLLDESYAVGRTPLETLGLPRMLRGGIRFRL